MTDPPKEVEADPATSAEPTRFEPSDGAPVTGTPVMGAPAMGGPAMGAPLMIVGEFGPSDMGTRLSHSAAELGLRVVAVELRGAYPPSLNLQRAYQRLVRPQPYRLREFSAHVVAVAQRTRPHACVATGNAPLTAWALQALARLGVSVVNFSTDDPWNPANRAAWRIETLRHYAAVFTPRRTNLAQLRQTGCPHVELMPFAYDPAVHHPASPEALQAERRIADVVFIGGADRDRLPFMQALADSGLRVALYGAYWDRHRRLRRLHGGSLTAPEMRSVLGRAKMSVCLVRRANRDLHVMRSYEEPAMGSCVAMEDTADHRALFPDPVAAACLFSTPDELVSCARRLCADDALRERIRSYQHRAVTAGDNTYTDRLRRMLAVAGGDAGEHAVSAPAR